MYVITTGGEEATLGWRGRKLRACCLIICLSLLWNRGNSGLLGTPVYYSLKLGGGGG